MEMTKCNSCKTVVAKSTDEGRAFQQIRISSNGYFCSVDLDLCKDCLKKSGLQGLIKGAEEEPEPLLEALRELIREEVDAALDQ